MTGYDKFAPRISPSKKADLKKIDRQFSWKKDLRIFLGLRRFFMSLWVFYILSTMAVLDWMVRRLYPV